MARKKEAMSHDAGEITNKETTQFETFFKRAATAAMDLYMDDSVHWYVLRQHFRPKFHKIQGLFSHILCRCTQHKYIRQNSLVYMYTTYCYDLYISRAHC